MKTPNDPRHVKRRQLVEELFKRDFHTQPVSDKAREIYELHEKIDKAIGLVAPEYPIEKINKVDLAIMRLAIYELLMDKKEPPHVIIDEAIELAKEYGNDTSPAFINGALGKVIKDEKITEL